MNKHLTRSLVLLVLAFVVIADSHAQNLRVCLGINEIPGESSVLRDQIDAISFSLNAQKPATNERTGAAASARTIAGPLKVVKRIDAASPALFAEAMSGRIFPRATLTVLRPGPGGRNDTVMTITLTSVALNSYKTSLGEGGSIVEEIELNYGQIRFAYRRANGSMVERTWDTVRNRP